MGWLLAAVVLVLLVISKGFRKVFLILAAIAVVLGIIITAVIWVNRSYENQSRIASRKLIPLNQIELIDLKLGGHQLSGRVRNNSKKYTLTRIYLDIAIHDVTTRPDGTSQDDVIGEAKNTEIFVSVPPGQVRDFDDYISAGSTEVKGKMHWTFIPLYTEANK